MKKEKVNSFLLTIVLLFYSLFYLVKPIYNLLNGYNVIFNIIIISILIFLNFGSITNKKNKIVLLGIQIFLLFLSFIINNTGLGSILQILCLTLILMLIPAIKIDIDLFKKYKYSIFAFFILFLLIDKSYFNTNYVGYIFFSLYLIFILLFDLDKKDKFLYLLLTTFLFMIIIYAFRCRTAVMMSFFSFIFISFKTTINKNEKLKKSVPYFIIFGSIIFAIFYVALWKFDFRINILFFAKKSFFSGRNRLWYEAFNLILKSPILGVGSSYQLTQISSFALHNTVIMILALFGIPFFIAYFVCVKNVYNEISNSIKLNYSYNIIFVIFIILFIYDFFESYLFWSNYNMIFFIIMIYAINRNKYIDSKINGELYTKKKIYIFEEGIDRVGGVERIISTLSNNFVSKYDINVISYYKTRDNTFYEYNSKINIEYLHKRYIQKSQKIGKKSYKYYFYRILEIIEDFIFVDLKIYDITNRISDKDIVICGRTDVALRILPKLYNYKNIIIRDAIHLSYHNKYKQKRIIRTLNNKKCTLILSSSESKNIYKKLLNKNVKLKKIYNPLGIKPIVNYDINSKTIISVGRYGVQKGFENLVKAFKIVLEKYPDWNLKIVGGSDEKILKLVKNLNVKNIEITSENKNIVELLNKSAIYVMASRYEGYANALVEAVACGIPSVTYDWLYGAEEIIKNKNIGIIVNLKNREEYSKYIDSDDNVVNLANAIIYLIENKKLREEMSINGYNYIKDTRNLKNIISQWERLINE